MIFFRDINPLSAKLLERIYHQSRKAQVRQNNKPGRGRKPTFSAKQKAQIKDWAKQEPRQLKKVAQKIKEVWEIEVSIKTIQRVLKQLEMSWHRMRRGVAGKPNPQEYEEKKAQLEELQQLEDEGKINLYYIEPINLNVMSPNKRLILT